MGILSYAIFFAAIVAIFSIATLGLNLQWGSTGLFNAGVAGFHMIGGYALAILTATPKAGLIGHLGLPWAAGLLGAIVASAVAALVIGTATVRLRGDYLAVATFGIAVTIQLVALNWEGLTGGSLGIASIPRPAGGLFTTSFGYNAAFLAFVVLLCGFMYWALERAVRSPWGRALKAIREDETAALALGKNVRALRLQAFVIGSTLIGLSGALYVTFLSFVSPFDFQPILTFQIWAMLIVGGSGNNRGALLGTLLVWALWTGSGTLVAAVVPASHQTQGGALQGILIGLVIVATLMFRPQGLIGEEPVVSRHVRD